MEIVCVVRERAKLTSRIQPHWTSAYDGYGLSSLETDVLEMGALVDHIRSSDGVYTSPCNFIEKGLIHFIEKGLMRRYKDSSDNVSLYWISRRNSLPHISPK